MVSSQAANPTESGLKIHYLHETDTVVSPELGQDVIQGLSQSPKTLPTRYLYDEKGSQLFEQICELPEYYPTRTEANILRQYASKIASMTGLCELIELGSGSSTKTRLLLDAYAGLGQDFTYIPVDVSAEILVESAKQLLQEYDLLHVKGLVGTYEEALTFLQPSHLPTRMILFLGSTLGNFTPQECDRFFAEVTQALQPGDYFLLGVDLQKPKDVLEPAYNDSQGVTAAFDLNILDHLNWRFGGNLNTEFFRHQAIYNEEQGQIEMYLQCQKSHSARLEALDFTVNFTEGEWIRTEISRKFNLTELQNYLQQQDLVCQQAWTNEQQWFGVLLCKKQ
ncbi:L-histidine N(alpha)-methyltransferase [Spirulina sp. CS-785/01]|uniref:L-histidine N(alpha)-methyltransferase n=1 Tax=Spirulina sp. CS-785/01 TaxID=3021716 RepID=UPI0023303BE9|nr:L-histidine N(alpha)-methyltransferase [Spirulina sp. CS-785/01]MDB9314148.1 L-histidine N(alpha)-methyltransferase [Spirulina sp. CS-785/01]